MLALQRNFPFLGEQTSARGYIERMLERYVAPVNRSDVVRFQFDQRVTARITLSRVLWLQGFADQAMRTVAGAIDDALAQERGALDLPRAVTAQR